MIPVARTANILITEVDNEVMIYDRERDDCHCLNPIATKVYYYADGRNTVDDIATFLEQELELSEDVDIRGLVWLALEELEKCDLLKEYLREPLPNVLEMSRRKVLGKTTRFAGAMAIGTLFPMVSSTKVAAVKGGFQSATGGIQNPTAPDPTTPNPTTPNPTTPNPTTPNPTTPNPTTPNPTTPNPTTPNPTTPNPTTPNPTTPNPTTPTPTPTQCFAVCPNSAPVAYTCPPGTICDSGCDQPFPSIYVPRTKCTFV